MAKETVDEVPYCKSMWIFIAKRGHFASRVLSLVDVIFGSQHRTDSIDSSTPLNSGWNWEIPDVHQTQLLFVQLHDWITLVIPGLGPRLWAHLHPQPPQALLISYGVPEQSSDGFPLMFRRILRCTKLRTFFEFKQKWMEKRPRSGFTALERPATNHDFVNLNLFATDAGWQWNWKKPMKQQDGRFSFQHLGIWNRWMMYMICYTNGHNSLVTGWQTGKHMSTFWRLHRVPVVISGKHPVWLQGRKWPCHMPKWLVTHHYREWPLHISIQWLYLSIPSHHHCKLIKHDKTISHSGPFELLLGARATSVDYKLFNCSKCSVNCQQQSLRLFNTGPFEWTLCNPGPDEEKDPWHEQNSAIFWFRRPTNLHFFLCDLWTIY